MRYGINFDKLVNRLVPHYMGGRKLILYLQAILKPMQTINESFAEYAKETRIEASMTSQIFKFEWFLNRKLKKYFLEGGSISIRNSEHSGTPIYYEDANVDASSHLLMYQSNEDEANNSSYLYRQNEKAEDCKVSFVVTSPMIDTTLITQEQYDSMLKNYIDKYRISGKTYLIKYISNEGV